MWTQSDEQRMIKRIRDKATDRLIEEYVNEPPVPQGTFRCTRCGDRTNVWERGVCDDGAPCLWVKEILA